MLQDHRYMHLKVYIFKVKPIHADIFIICNKTTRLHCSTQGSQKMAEPIIIPHFIEPVLATAKSKKLKSQQSNISKFASTNPFNTSYLFNVTFADLNNNPTIV